MTDQPKDLRAELASVLADLDKYLVGCPPLGTPLVKKPSRLLLRCRDFLRKHGAALSSHGGGGEAEYEFEVWQDDSMQAGGSCTDYATAKGEADHYALMYGQDGPVEVRLYEKRRITTPPTPSAPDREADRRRFPDADFNAWLDTEISDCGHTVWSAVGDVQAAWQGWEARQFAGDAVLLAECCGREECGGECGNGWLGMAMYRKPTGDDDTPPSAPVVVEAVGIVGERGDVSWRSERILPPGAKLYALSQQPAAPGVEGGNAILPCAVNEVVGSVSPQVAAAGEDGWRPIESAPKDGTRVLLSSGGSPYVGRFVGPPKGSKEWTDDSGQLRDPTHWMPLPAAPTPEQR